jgi:hypothetical protein
MAAVMRLNKYRRKNQNRQHKKLKNKSDSNPQAGRPPLLSDKTNRKQNKSTPQKNMAQMRNFNYLKIILKLYKI